MEHYYTNNPTTKSCEKIISSKIKDIELQFYTDNGVFSKENVDFGTKVLLENFYSKKEYADVADVGCGYGVISIFFDIVLTNPPIRAGKQIVHKIMTDSFEHLKSDGELWVVIQKKQGMASCKKLLENLFNSVEVIAKNKGYYILKAAK